MAFEQTSAMLAYDRGTYATAATLKPCVYGHAWAEYTVVGQRLLVLGNQSPMAGNCGVRPNALFKCNHGKTEAVS